MKKVFLIILEELVPPNSVWEKIFDDLEFVKIVDDIPVECDALVVTPSRCEAFGCPAGKTDENTGIMYIYDQNDLPEKYRYHPRFLISNAVWKKDPHLIDAVRQRIRAFVKAVSEFNKTSLLIEQPAIKTETFGFWQDYSDEIQEQAIFVLKAEIVNAFAGVNKEETILFRPVGEKEFVKIRQSQFKAFPPRLPEQPIFYPVLNYDYAVQIARDWNTKDEKSGFVGYVTRFKVRSEYLKKYQVKTVGGSKHQEYWIPAENLNEFNDNIVGKIEVIEKFIPTAT